MNAKLNATLEAGTKYFVENPDGTRSADRVLAADTAALTLALDEHIHIYKLEDGEVIFVLAENDK